MRHVDLLPTFLELLGIGQPTPARELDGSSLVPLLTAEANSPGALMAREALSEDFTHGRDVRALVSGSWKLVEDKRIGTVELYDLSSDPKERENVATQMPERTESLRRRLADLTTGRGEVAR